jgi:hypothetical protein
MGSSALQLRAIARQPAIAVFAIAALLAPVGGARAGCPMIDVCAR